MPRALTIGLLLTAAILGSEGTTMPADSTWNVMDFGAVADGETDNTAAFQEALESASTARGGAVLIPAGRFSFDGSLEVPHDVAVRGVHRYSPTHTGIRDKGGLQPVYGSVLMPRGGAGSEDGPAFVQLNANSVLHCSAT